MLKVGIILGSTRPGRAGDAVARWIFEIAQKRADASFELVDLLDYQLPILDEPAPPSLGRYTKEHTKRWSAKIGSLDAFVFVTAEYQHGIPGGLKNAIDYLYAEWVNKAAGFVSYGSMGGVRAVEQLRLVLAEVQVATVRAQVPLLLGSDFVEYRTFKPGPTREAQLQTMLDQLVAWGNALAPLRRT